MEERGLGLTPDILWDSDFGEYIEAASFTLFQEPNPKISAAVDEGIDMIIGAQQEDGYIGIHHTSLSQASAGQVWFITWDCTEEATSSTQL